MRESDPYDVDSARVGFQEPRGSCRQRAGNAYLSKKEGTVNASTPRTCKRSPSPCKRSHTRALTHVCNGTRSLGVQARIFRLVYNAVHAQAHMRTLPVAAQNPLLWRWAVGCPSVRARICARRMERAANSEAQWTGVISVHHVGYMESIEVQLKVAG